MLRDVVAWRVPVADGGAVVGKILPMGCGMILLQSKRVEGVYDWTGFQRHVRLGTGWFDRFTHGREGVVVPLKTWEYPVALGSVPLLNGEEVQVEAQVSFRFETGYEVGYIQAQRLVVEGLQESSSWSLGAVCTALTARLRTAAVADCAARSANEIFVGSGPLRDFRSQLQQVLTTAAQGYLNGVGLRLERLTLGHVERLAHGILLEKAPVRAQCKRLTLQCGDFQVVLLADEQVGVGRNAEITLGQLSETAQLQTYERLSRIHCTFRRRERVIEVCDGNGEADHHSTNGTFLEGHRVVAWTTLPARTYVRLGSSARSVQLEVTVLAGNGCGACPLPQEMRTACSAGQARSVWLRDVVCAQRQYVLVGGCVELETVGFPGVTIFRAEESFGWLYGAQAGWWEAESNLLTTAGAIRVIEMQ